jgi:hypothetical protein
MAAELPDFGEGQLGRPINLSKAERCAASDLYLTEAELQRLAAAMDEYPALCPQGAGMSKKQRDWLQAEAKNYRSNRLEKASTGHLCPIANRLCHQYSKPIT